MRIELQELDWDDISDVVDILDSEITIAFNCMNKTICDMFDNKTPVRIGETVLSMNIEYVFICSNIVYCDDCIMYYLKAQ